MQRKFYNLHIRMKHLLGLGLSFVSCLSLKRKQSTKTWIRIASNHTQYLRKRKYSVNIHIKKFFLLLPRVYLFSIKNYIQRPSLEKAPNTLILHCARPFAEFSACPNSNFQWSFTIGSCLPSSAEIVLQRSPVEHSSLNSGQASIIL